MLKGNADLPQAAEARTFTIHRTIRDAGTPDR